MRSVAALVLMLLLALQPTISASSRVDAGVAVVIVSDDRGNSCSLHVATTCQGNATLNATDPGNGTIDVHQRINYVGVATNSRGIVPLPNETLTIRGEDIVVPDPVLPAVTEFWDRYQNFTTPYTNATLISNDSGIYLRYFGPTTYDPTGPWDTRYPGADYSAPGHQGLHSDSIGPYNAPAPGEGVNVRNYTPGFELFVCSNVHDSPLCHSEFQWVENASNRSVPSIVWGVDWYDLQAATDPTGLTPPAAGNRSVTWENVTVAPWANGTLNESIAHDDVAPEHRASPRADPRTALVPPPRRERSNVSTQGSHTQPMPPAALSTGVVPIVVAAASAAVVLIAILAAGYSRFNSKRDVLGNPRRLAILQAVKADPGINVTRLATQLGIERRAVRHHLSLLSRWGMITTVRASNEVRCYPPGEADADPAGGESVARAQIVALLSASPEGLTRKAIHSALPSIPLRTRNHAIQKLMALGRIKAEPVRGRGASRLVLAGSA